MGPTGLLRHVTIKRLLPLRTVAGSPAALVATPLHGFEILICTHDACVVGATLLSQVRMHPLVEHFAHCAAEGHVHKERMKHTATPLQRCLP